MREYIDEAVDFVRFAVPVLALVALSVGMILGLIWGLEAAFGSGEQVCTVTLSSGDAVIRHECKAMYRGSGVLYCAEVDYAPAAWVTVTCEGSRP